MDRSAIEQQLDSALLTEDGEKAAGQGPVLEGAGQWHSGEG